MRSFPYLRALLDDAKTVKPTWDFDAQQADPIHNIWNWDDAREEIRQLIKHPDELFHIEIAVKPDTVTVNYTGGAVKPDKFDVLANAFSSAIKQVSKLVASASGFAAETVEKIIYRKIEILKK